MTRKIWTTVETWVRQESAATQVLITAFIALGIAFQWWTWTNAETGAVIGIVTAVLGMFVRSQVTPLIRPTISERHARDLRVERLLTPAEISAAAEAGSAPHAPPPPPRYPRSD
ncbi:MAG TPA: hypothetical protein VGS62_03840 [Streptosporangiaceae bacterium]|nr:hypothetical protein [Streptosporangiaceae bacterium]